MKRFMVVVPLILAVGLGVTLGLLQLLDQTTLVHAAGFRYVAPDGLDSNDCSSPAARCQTIQRAVDVAVVGDVIKVAAGTYYTVTERPSPSGYNDVPTLTQVVFINAIVTIQGGYTTTNDFADPATAVSTVDPQGLGRGIYIAPGVTVTLQGLHLVGGSAAGLGGGAAPSSYDAGGGLYADRAAVIISDCLIASNVAESAGGLYINSGSFIMQQSVISGNVVDTSHAGGLYIHSPSAATIRDNDVLSNTAASSGGGVYIAYGSSENLFSGNRLIGNQAGGGGGGIYMESAMALINNQFMRNSAVSRGGGLYVDGRSPLIESNQFSDNDGGNGAGGVYLLGDTAVFRGNTVISNTSGNNGGGLWLDGSEGAFESNIVAQNQIEGANLGAGIYIEGGVPGLAHTTLAQNSGGDGSGIYIDGQVDMTLVNTILVSQTTAVYAASGSTLLIDGILWYENTTNVSGAGTVVVSHEYIGDPIFVNPAGWDYHISKGSAALNRGINIGVSTDIDGDGRYGAPDLGADEYVYDWQIYLPVIFRE